MSNRTIVILHFDCQNGIVAGGNGVKAIRRKLHRWTKR